MYSFNFLTEFQWGLYRLRTYLKPSDPLEMDGVVSSSSPTANEAGDIVVVVVCDEEISGLLDFSSSCDLEELLCNITASSTSASDSSSSAETLLYSTSEGDPAEDLVVRNSNRSFPHYNNTKMSDFMKVLEDYSSDEVTYQDSQRLLPVCDCMIFSSAKISE